MFPLTTGLDVRAREAGLDNDEVNEAVSKKSRLVSELVELLLVCALKWHKYTQEIISGITVRRTLLSTDPAIAVSSKNKLVTASHNRVIAKEDGVS